MTDHHLLTLWRREPKVFEWACTCGHAATARSIPAAVKAHAEHAHA